MTRRRLFDVTGADLGPALADASTAMIDAGEGEVWELPPGRHELVGPLSLGDDALDLTLTGPRDLPCTLVVDGGLHLRGAATVLEQLRIETRDAAIGAALDGERVSVRHVVLRAEGSADCTALSIDSRTAIDLVSARVEEARAGEAATGIHVHGVDASLTGVSIATVHGAHAVGLRGDLSGVVSLDDLALSDMVGDDSACALDVGRIGHSGSGGHSPDRMRVSGLRANGVRAADAQALRLHARTALSVSGIRIDGVYGTSSGVGLAAKSGGRLDVAGAVVEDVRGASSAGLRVRCSGDEGGGLSVIDATIRRVDGTGGYATGLELASSGPLVLRGFTVEAVVGDSASGVVAVAGGDLEVFVGSVDRVKATTHGQAAGARLFAGPAGRPAVVGDLRIEAIWGAMPTDPLPSLGTWTAWAETDVLDALEAGTLDPTTPLTLPDLGGNTGLHLGACVDALDQAIAGREPGSARVEDCVVRRVAGAALLVVGGLRTVLVQRIEAYKSLAVGYAQGEQLLLAWLTIHRHKTGLVLGPGEARIYNSIVTWTAEGPPLVFGPDTQRAAVRGVAATGGHAPLWALEDPPPFEKPGPSGIPPAMETGVFATAAEVDLQVASSAAHLHDRAVEVPGLGEAPLHVGAHAPSEPVPCSASDPEPFPWTDESPEEPPGPVVDYRARDFLSLRELMMDRSRTTMESWTERNAADFTTMAVELLAERLDHLSLAQETAASEGYLETARLRRSIEDHARALDYVPDPGLSASVMLRFSLDPEELTLLDRDNTPDREPAELRLLGGPSEGITDDDDVFEIPQGTVVGNVFEGEHSVVFATEEPLFLSVRLDRMRLAEDCRKGEARARIAGRHPHLHPGRWLLLLHGALEGGHPVRLTGVELATDTTLVYWDPRRPADRTYPADGDEATTIYGNVVPASHGLPLDALRDEYTRHLDDVRLRRWREMLEDEVDGREIQEVELAFPNISVRAPGYPFPGDEHRRGRHQIRVTVDGDPWRVVDDLAQHGPGDEVCVLRPSHDGGTVLRFGDGINGSALPSRPVQLALDIRAGLGSAGNVTTGVLTRLMWLGRPARSGWDVWSVLGTEREEGLEAAWAEQGEDQLRRLIKVTNPLPAVGGRDPEMSEQIRYRAPYAVRDALSAVVPADYERLVGEVPEVRGVHARADVGATSRRIGVTILLRDEDTLDGEERLRKERLRRWANVRRRLEDIRLLGFDVEAMPPSWIPLDLDLAVDAAPWARADVVHDAVVEAVAGDRGLLDPDVAGLGGDVHLDRLHQAALAVPGVEGVRVLRFRRFGPHSPDHLHDGVIPIREHEVATVRSPRSPRSDGLLTVRVCGGIR